MSTSDHFADVNKMIVLAKGAQKFPSHSEQLPPAEDVRKVERRLAKKIRSRWEIIRRHKSNTWCFHNIS